MLRILFLICFFYNPQYSFCYNYHQNQDVPHDESFKQMVGEKRRNVYSDKGASKVFDKRKHGSSHHVLDVADFIQSSNDASQIPSYAMDYDFESGKTAKDYHDYALQKKSGKARSLKPWRNNFDYLRSESEKDVGVAPLTKDKTIPSQYNVDLLSDLQLIQRRQSNHAKCDSHVVSEKKKQPVSASFVKLSPLRKIKFPFFSHNNKPEISKGKLKKKRKLFYFCSKKETDTTTMSDFYVTNKSTGSVYKFNAIQDSHMHRMLRDLQKRSSGQNVICPVCKNKLFDDGSVSSFHEGYNSIQNSREFVKKADNLNININKNDDIKQRQHTESRNRKEEDLQKKQLQDLERVEEKVNSVKDHGYPDITDTTTVLSL